LHSNAKSYLYVLTRSSNKDPVETEVSKFFSLIHFLPIFMVNFITMSKLTFILSFIMVSLVAKTQAQTATDEPKVAAMLKTFYTAYMSTFSDPDLKHGNVKEIELRKKYCTY